MGMKKKSSESSLMVDHPITDYDVEPKNKFKNYPKKKKNSNKKNANKMNKKKKKTKKSMKKNAPQQEVETKDIFDQWEELAASMKNIKKNLSKRNNFSSIISKIFVFKKK